MKISEKNKSILFLLLIFFAIVSISIGYCVVNDTSLEIEGIAKATASKSLYIDTVEIDKTSSTAGVSIGSYIKENTLLQISSLTLPKENVTEDTNITLLVNVKNLSEYSFKFTGVSYLTAADLIGVPSFSLINSNPNIEIDQSSYQSLINTIIDGINGDEPGEMVVPIKFKYVDINNITDNTLDISIKLNFTKLENENYTLKTGKNLYSVISSHYKDATKIIFCAKTEVPKKATLLGEAGLVEGEIRAYWYNGTIYIASASKKSKIVFNKDSGYMFSNGNVNQAFSKVTSISVSNNILIDTSEVTQFEEMFKGCSSLTDDEFQSFINHFDTSSAINMCAMFGSMSSLTNINVSKFDTKNVTDMSWMFENNSSLSNITFGDKFVTSSVAGTKENEGFSGMFTNCTKLKILDLTSFETANVASMWRMFQNCTSLEKIYVSDKFVTTGLNTSAIKNSVNDVFSNCNNLEGDKGTKYSEKKYTTATYAHLDGGTENPGYFSNPATYTVILDANGGHFENGELIKTFTGYNKVDVKLENTLVYENKIFAGWALEMDAKEPIYYKNKTITFTKNITLYAVWNVNEISYKLKTGSNIYLMLNDYNNVAEHVKFAKVESVPEGSIFITNVDINNTGSLKSYYNENLKTIYITIDDSSKKIIFNEDSSHMFSNGNSELTAFNKLKTIEVEDGVEIDTSNVENFAEIFKYNVSLTQDSLQSFINKFDTSSVKNMCAMFEYLTFSEIDISKFNTKNVTDMSWLFHGSDFTTILFGDNYNTENVTKFDGMFQNMDYLEYLDISGFKVKSGATINYMFGKCPILKRIYVSETSGFENCGSGIQVFENSVSLVGGIGENETKFTSSEITKNYARISTKDTPGYFTSINDKTEEQN